MAIWNHSDDTILWMRGGNNFKIMIVHVRWCDCVSSNDAIWNHNGDTAFYVRSGKQTQIKKMPMNDGLVV